MNGQSRLDRELLEENSALKQRIQELEQSESERKQAEEELRSSQQQLRLLIEAGPDFFFLKDLDLRYQLVNSANATFFGRDEADILGRTDVELMPEGAAGACRESDLLAIREKRVIVTIEQVGDRFYETHKFPVCVADQTVGIAGIIRDVTEQRRTAEALLVSEARYRELVENANSIILRMNASGVVTFFNEYASRFLGFSQEEIIGRNVVGTIVPSIDSTGRDLAQMVLDFSVHPERYKSNENENICKDGTRVWVAWANKPILNNQGRYDEMLCIGNDITDRKRAEEALLESEVKYRTVVESSLVGVYVVQDGLLRFVNRRWCEIYGYTYDEIVDKVDPLDLTPPEDKELVEENFQKRLSGEIDHIEYKTRAIRKDGTIIMVNILGSRMLYRGRPAISGTALDITEQERAQEALRQKTALLEAQVNTSLDGIIVVNKGKKTLQNQQANDLLNIPRHIAESDDDEAQVEWVKSQVKDPEKFYEKTSHMLSDRDETVWDELELRDGRVLDRYSSPIIGKDGKHYGRIVTFRDITERRRSEEALSEKHRELQETVQQLEQSRNMLQLIIESIPIRVFWKDNEFRYLGCNRLFARDAGFNDPQQLVGKDDFAMGWREQVDRYRADDRRIMESGCPKIDIIEPQTTPTGTTIWLSTSKVPLQKPDGEVFGVLGVYEDITERKQAEEAVLESEEQFRRMFEGSPLGMVMTGADFRFSKANPAFCRMLGYTEQELTSLTFKDITYSDHLAEDVLQVNELISGKILLYQTEKRYIRKDKGVVWASARANIMRGMDDRFLYFLTTIEDITQRKESEEEKMRLESRLFRAQKMEAIGTLAGGIAHDFNNILTALVGYAGLLRMKISDATLQTYVDEILTASHKATDLIQSLLAFSRQQAIRLEPVILDRIIKGTEKLLKRLVTEDIAIKTLLAGEGMTVMADATQIDQILFNLATNARDAMPQGGTLTVETKTVELDDTFQRFHGYGEPGWYVLLSISDTGLGMDEAIRQKIFDPFFTTKEAGKGTGLGLSTVYGIVRQHNGYITVYSEPKIGTTFHIYLPATHVVGKEARPAPAPVKGGNETILVGEDNEAVRGLVIEILNEYGYTTIEAVDGADAIEQFKKAGRIDLLILDSVMPKKNGREAYNEIDKIKPDMRVIFMSGHTRDVILDKGVEDKNYNFLQKPISPDTLLREVREVLDDRQGSH